jgi:cell filamentation protein
VPGYTLIDGVTLKNKLGANDPDELERLEASYVAARYNEIDAGAGPSGQFDAEHIKAIHQHLFQDVYEWAGRTRDERVALSDGTIATEPILSKVDGQPFLIGPAIPTALDDIGAKLRDADYLHGLPREQFAERAADLLAELNAIRSGRETGGRNACSWSSLPTRQVINLILPSFPRNAWLRRASPLVSGAIHR